MFGKLVIVTPISDKTNLIGCHLFILFRFSFFFFLNTIDIGFLVFQYILKKKEKKNTTTASLIMFGKILNEICLWKFFILYSLSEIFK